MGIPDSNVLCVRKKYCCQLSVEKPVEDEINKQLGDYLFEEKAFPDYIFVPDRRLKRRISKLESQYGKGAYVIKQMGEQYWKEMTRPEIPRRNFGPSEKLLNQKRPWVFAGTYREPGQ